MVVFLCCSRVLCESLIEHYIALRGVFVAAIMDHRVRKLRPQRNIPSPRPLHWVLPSYPICDTIHNTYSVTAAASSRAAITAPLTPQQTTTTCLIATMQMMKQRPGGGVVPFQSAAVETRVCIIYRRATTNRITILLDSCLRIRFYIFITDKGNHTAS